MIKFIKGVIRRLRFLWSLDPIDEQLIKAYLGTGGIFSFSEWLRMTPGQRDEATKKTELDQNTIKSYMGAGGVFSIDQWLRMTPEERDISEQVFEDIEIFRMLFPIYLLSDNENKRIEIAKILDERGFGRVLDTIYNVKTKAMIDKINLQLEE